MTQTAPAAQIGDAVKPSVGQPSDQYVQHEPDPGQYVPPPAPPPAPEPAQCGAQPLNRAGWNVSTLLKIEEATTCRFKASWVARVHNVYGSWPRSYDYKPDAAGWIGDTFIRGHLRGDVQWNLATNAARVTSVTGGSALEVAKFAKSTMFPGLDLTQISS